MRETHKLDFQYSDDVVDQITQCCSEVETGARNIDHIMNDTVLPQMSREILSRMSEMAIPLELHLSVGEDGNFSIAFKGE